LKRVIEIKDIDSMYFAGPSDKNIKLIDKNFNCEIVLRGNELLVEGKKTEVEKLEKLVHNIVSAIARKDNISTNDIQILINSQLENHSGSTIEDILNEQVVLYTHKEPVYAKTKGQKKYLKAVKNNDIVFAIGPAGTGKTYQAVALAVSALKNNEVQKIIITRPAVEAGEHLGFLPGDMKDKVDPYLTPLYDALNAMLPKEKLKKYIDNRQIEIAPLAYMRGRTLHSSFIILDEAQNSTHMQMKMFLTRIGMTSKAIITGDITQIDLGNGNISGLVHASNILKKIKGIKFVHFDEEDVVRHRLVKNIIKAYSKEQKTHE
jgi:phosphate starvation-inducible PhoH-like protein